MWSEIWHWIVVGFSFGLGFAFGSSLGDGILSLFGRGRASNR
jgi:high-affinity nickel permease